MPKVGPRFRWLVAATAALVAGCLSPTMPMPPPNRPNIEGPNEQGVVVLSGHALRESRVYADNENTGLSYGQRASAVTGAYRFAIVASVGDFISMHYSLDDEESMTLRFEIPKVTLRPSATGVAGAAGAAGAASSVSGAAGATGGTPAFASAGATGSDGSASAGATLE